MISMTSVGYGDIVASTHIGRCFAIIAIISGAFMTALLVGQVVNWFTLEANKEKAINKIQESRLAVKTIKAML